MIYQGHHGDKGAEIADVVLPGAAYTEKSGTYVNTEGRAQEATFVVAPPGKAREDWQIIRAVSEVIGSPLPYNDLESLRKRMSEVSPTLRSLGKRESASFGSESGKLATNAKSNSSEPLRAWQTELTDYYMTNPISRSSKTMAECVKAFEQRNAASNNTASKQHHHQSL